MEPTGLKPATSSSQSIAGAIDRRLDNHIIYALLLVGLVPVGAGNTFGFGRRWSQTTLVRRYARLK